MHPSGEGPMSKLRDILETNVGTGPVPGAVGAHVAGSALAG